MRGSGIKDAVRETKEKLETLKAAAEQANEALAKGEITQEQYDGLQREIIETEEKDVDIKWWYYFHLYDIMSVSEESMLAYLTSGEWQS